MILRIQVHGDRERPTKQPFSSPLNYAHSIEPRGVIIIGSRTRSIVHDNDDLSPVITPFAKKCLLCPLSLSFLYINPLLNDLFTTNLTRDAQASNKE